LAVLECIQKGSLEIDAPLEIYLPELRGSTIGGSVSIKHLLSHTTGHKGPEPFELGRQPYLAWDSYVAVLSGSTPFFEPGRVFDYQFSDSAILGEVVRRIEGRSVDELVRERVTEPLGLRAGTASSDHLDCESQPAHHVCTPSKDVRWAELRELEACVPEIWRASMSDLTMSTKDWLTIAEAMTQPQPDVNWSTPGLVASLQTPVVSVPTAINDPFPEMTPIAFAM
jgi:CubicO group peptidase (beta-lactamase class C family)